MIWRLSVSVFEDASPPTATLRLQAAPMLMFDGSLVKNQHQSPPLACSFRTFTDIDDDDDSLIQCGGSAIHGLIPICWFHGKINGLAKSRSGDDADADGVYVQAYRGCSSGNSDDDFSLRMSPAFLADMTIFSYFGDQDTVMVIFEGICNDMVLVGSVTTTTTAKNATIEIRRVGGSRPCGSDADVWVLDVKAMRDIFSGETINVDVDDVRSRFDGDTVSENTPFSLSMSRSSRSSLYLLR